MAKARARFKLFDRDNGLERLRQLADELSTKGYYVKVGVVGKVREREDGERIGNAELAAVHEFGAPSRGIPERSFIRSSFDVNRDAYVDMARRLLRLIIIGEIDTRKALALLGTKAAADIKARAMRGPGIPPPNAPETLRRKLAKTRKGSKGQPRTLVDTGRMIASVTYAVVLNNREAPTDG